MFRGTLARAGLWPSMAVVVALSTTVAGAEAGHRDDRPAAGDRDCAAAAKFARRNFPSAVRIDNRYLPFAPGTQYVLEGVSNRTGEPLPHRVTFTVTDLTKRVNGVNSLVVWDVDVNEDVVVESELAFFAQDTRGHVWNLGEYPEEFGFDASGEYVFLGAPNTWIAGQEDAKAGIHMLRDPRVGASYLQGFAPAIDFLDCATVVDTDAEVCVPAGCFEDVVVTHETSPLDPTGGIQVKHHAPGVGIVSIAAIDDPEGETLVLVAINRLSRPQLRAAREAALELDERAYEISEVYGATGPARRVSSDD